MTKWPSTRYVAYNHVFGQHSGCACAQEMSSDVKLYELRCAFSSLCDGLAAAQPLIPIRCLMEEAQQPSAPRWRLQAVACGLELMHLLSCNFA